MPDHGSGPLGDAEWDARYAESDPIWSGHPNTALVTEATDLTPGRARHVTSGAGAHHVAGCGAAGPPRVLSAPQPASQTPVSGLQ
ncbi:MAG: hypothetical protein ABIZ07_02805 [Dermatophilaceae bacterium]